MKKVIYYFSCIAASMLLTQAVYAQTQNQAIDKNAPRSLTDPAMSERLQKDLNTRNTQTTNQPISWFDSGDGYYGTYSNEDQNYMTRYDKKGNYIETMRRKEWNDMVPSDLRSSFDQSSYKSQLVTNYWEVSDPNRKGYYLELNDNSGKITKVWADDKGNFSTTPYKATKPKN